MMRLATRRLPAPVIDQALSSVSNALLLVVLARLCDPRTFGTISLFFLCLTASVGIARGFLGSRILLQSRSPGCAAEVRHATTVAGAAGLVLGVAGGLVSLGLGLPVACIALAIGWPVVLVQDVLRYGSIASGRPRVAVVGDGLWVAVMVGLLAVSTVVTVTPAVAVAGWVGGGLLALVWFLRSLRLPRGGEDLATWWQRHARQRWGFGLESTLAVLAPLASAAIVTASLGPAATGALRGVSTFTGPISLLLTALPLAVVPLVVGRSPQEQRRPLWPALAKVALLVSPLGLVVVALPWLLPPTWGAQLLGATWPAAVVLLPLVGLEYVGLSWMHAATAGLRAVGAAGPLLRLRLGFVVASLVSTTITASQGDLRLVCAGSAVVAAVAAIVAIVLLRRLDRPGWSSTLPTLPQPVRAPVHDQSSEREGSR